MVCRVNSIIRQKQRVEKGKKEYPVTSAQGVLKQHPQDNNQHKANIEICPISCGRTPKKEQHIQ
tara:strand:+ start:991 stop:1182 length:192 start_codon:yes stop_codon:yes gene_type:complete